MSNPIEDMNYADYSQLNDKQRKALWKAGQTKQEAIQKIRLADLPPKSEDQKLLAEIETRITSLKKAGMNADLFEREREQIQSRIDQHAEREAREQSLAGQQTAATFAEYRKFVLTHGGVDDVVVFDSKVEHYWQSGGDGNSMSDDWAKAISGYVALRVRVETAAQAAADAAQAEADQSKRVADLKQHDANQLKDQTTDNEQSQGDDTDG